MNLFLILTFLFFIGSVSGWLLELLFRRYFSSSNPERKWINPGFCIGPYLPLYGIGLCVLYLLASLNIFNIINPVFNKTLIFILMAVCMTAVEYIAGIISVKVFKIRLWDYSNEWGNIQGIICPKFSLIWALLGSVYYFLIHPYILNSLKWLSQNLAFSFVIGLFFGIFIIDAVKSAQLITKLKRFADEKDVIVKYEHLKEYIRKKQEKTSQKHYFFRPFHSNQTITENLKEMFESFEKHKKH